jgi:hypothetical protein
MTELGLVLVPLAIGSAVVPVQLLVTILLLRSRGGRTTAVAWIAGMTTDRLAQGLVFGLLLDVGGGTGGTGRSQFESAVLVVLAVAFYVAAARKYLNASDEDGPPPAWIGAFLVFLLLA